jgi:hypothetical protein
LRQVLDWKARPSMTFITGPALRVNPVGVAAKIVCLTVNK